MAAFTPIFAAGKLSGGLLPVAVLVWLRFIGGAATIVSVAAVKRVPVFTRVSPLWKLHLMRAFCGVGGLACSIYAASVLPLADATAIGLTKGIIAIVLAGLILKEVITGRHWSQVCCALQVRISWSGLRKVLRVMTSLRWLASCQRSWAPCSWPVKP